MKSVILIAPPSAGKGTQANLIKEKYGFEHISTGDLLRDIIASGSEYGNKINQIVNSGELVSDDIVIDLLKKKLQKINNSKGYILDGFPRDLNQAICYDKILKEIKLPNSIVIYIDLDKDIATKRVIGRLLCPNCDAVYNEYFDDTRPKNIDLCDKCGTQLIKRSDDTIETFSKRYDIYYETIKPLLNFYKEKGILFKVNGNLSKDDVFEQIKNILEAYNDKY